MGLRAGAQTHRTHSGNRGILTTRKLEFVESVECCFSFFDNF